jgi:hypothetical protein
MDTAVTMRGETDDETITFIQREEGIVIVTISHREELAPPTYSAPQSEITMREIVEEARKKGWNFVGGPSLRKPMEKKVVNLGSLELPRSYSRRDGKKYNPIKRAVKKQETFTDLPTPQQVMEWASGR